MRRLSMPLGAALLLLLVAAATPAAARVSIARVVRDDRTLIPITDHFGFGRRGHLDLTLSDIKIYQPVDRAVEPNPDNFGFFLLAEEAGVALDEDLLEQKCPLDGRENKLFTFADKNVAKLLAKEIASFKFHLDVDNGGLYYLYFANCEAETPLSFTVRTEMYNVRAGDGKRDYLSVGETELDVVYWVMFGLFAALTLAWAAVLVRGRRDGTAQRIHWLMLALATAKSATLFTEALMTSHVEATGSADGWDVAFFIFTFLRGLLFFVVLVLIGTGWSYMKPFIDDNTKRVLLVVVPAQVLANIALVIVDEESPAVADWMTWRDVLHVVDLVCCAAVLFPIVWSIKQLRDAAGTDGKAARSLEKLTLFRSFYISVVAYIYFTRIVVLLLDATVEYTYAWVSAAAAELATLAFYVFVGVSFRPHRENRYLKLQQEEIELG